MPVRFNGNQLRPAPLVDVQKQYNRGEDGLLDSVEYSFTLTGTIVNTDSILTDSPGALSATGMVGILSEQQRIRTIFASGIGLLEIESPDAATNKISTYAKVDSITFNQGTWVNRNDYSIILTANNLIGEDDPISSLANASDSWSITENEDGTFGISHTVQAQGRKVWSGNGIASGTLTSNNPLSDAKDWVLSQLTLNNNDGTWGGGSSFSIANLVYPLASGVNFWNKSVTQNVDPSSYSWTLTENFIYNPSGSVREDSSITVNYENGIVNRATVSVNGAVLGYANNASNSSTRFNNAKNYFSASVEPNLYTRVSAYLPGGFTLNPNFSSKQITHEPNAGNVRYSINYIATSGATIVADAIEESINISDAGPTDVFAQIQVPGRVNGPVVQAMYTKTLPERTVSISATLASSGSITLSSLLSQYLAKPNTNVIIDALKPSTGYYYIKQDSEEWNPLRRQYARTTSWVIQPEGSTIAGMPSGIRNNSPT